MHTWVPAGCGRRGFHIFNIYGHVGAGKKNPVAFQKNAAFLQQVFQAAALLGEVPWIVVGDFQTNPSESPTLGTLCSNHTAHDLGAIYTDAAWTFQKGDNSNIRTRIDLAICNSAMLSHVADVTILRESNLPGHCPIQIQFDFPAFLDHKMVYHAPLPFPKNLPKLDNAQTSQLEHKVWDGVLNSFREAIAQHDVNEAFRIWTTTAEKFCSLLTTHRESCPRQWFGRGRKVNVIKKSLQAAPAEPLFGAATHRLSSLLKLQRRLNQLKAKLRYDPDTCSTTFIQLQSLQHNIQSSWCRIFQRSISHQVLCSHAAIQELCVTVKQAMLQEQQSVTEKRLLTFKQSLIQDWNANRKATYTWLRDQPPFSTPCFKINDEQYVTKHAELHQMMIDSWGPIFNRYQKSHPPSYENFRREFPHALPPDRTYSTENPFTLPTITSQDVSEIIFNLKPSSAGIDFWQTHELQSLGPFSIQMLAELLQAIEDSQKWPENLLEVPVATIKKGAGLSPLEIRPIALTSHLYRIWAKSRWRQRQSWHLSWVPFELKGGIADRQAIDSYFEVALELEQSQFTKHPLFGILYDYQKCFDNVSWPIDKGILTDLGMPAPTMGAMFAFNENIQRRFKFGNSVGPAFGNTNSICQGCPLAILRINALIASWVHVVQNIPNCVCRSSAFIDDKKFTFSFIGRSPKRY